MADKKPVTKRPAKTLKERKFVKAYIETGNATKAVLAAGYDTNADVARRIGSQNLSKLDISSYFDKAGLTDEVLAQNTARIALTAKKRDQFSGEMYEDDRTQLEGMKFAAQLKGLLVTKNEVTGKDGGPIQVEKATFSLDDIDAAA